MYGTIVQNSFTKTEAPRIAEFLEDLCSPNDSYGWSSTGIYTFWDYDTHEILYIGLAIDLTERFKQHNGLIRSSKSGTKNSKIQEYFQSNNRLGYSVLLQSPLGQAITRKNFPSFSPLFRNDSKNYTVRDFNKENTKVDLRELEGLLIESFNKIHGHLPLWNSVGGSMAGQAKAKDKHYELLNAFTTNDYSPFVSRSTLEELSNDPTLERYENFLHVIRFRMLQVGHSFDDALSASLKLSSSDAATFKEIHENDYLCKQPIV